MMTVLIKAAQLILSLSILVIIHEFGHYTFAKLFKTRVEKFYLFFDLGFSFWKQKIADTEYGIGWLPLGGYVKISGMIDESMDKEQMAKPAEPWEFRSKTAGQRLLIMIGGVLYNFIFAALLYAAIVFTWGDTYIPNANVKYGVVCSYAAKQVGFQNGDKLISIDGKPVDRFYEANIDLLLNGANEVKVLRNNVVTSLLISSADMDTIRAYRAYHLFAPRALNYTINRVVDTMAAAKAGLMEGDVITSIQGESVDYNDQLPPIMKSHASQNVELCVLRNQLEVPITLTVPDNGIIGIYSAIDTSLFKTDYYGFFASIPQGIKMGTSKIVSYVKQLKFLFVAKGAVKDLGGFGTIASIFPAEWNWEAFWTLTAFLSVALGVMNILPIPALDGGHVMFLVYEVITRRKPNEKFMEYAQLVGMILLIGLLLFVNGNDILKLFHK